jgi:hypothetical protein
MNPWLGAAPQKRPDPEFIGSESHKLP